MNTYFKYYVKVHGREAGLETKIFTIACDNAEALAKQYKKPVEVIKVTTTVEEISVASYTGKYDEH